MRLETTTPRVESSTRVSNLVIVGYNDIAITKVNMESREKA